MKITAIKAQVKNQGRVSVYVDGKYSFSLNHAQLLEQKLRVGLEIDTQQLQNLQNASNLGKMFDRALNYVTIRPRSVKEVTDYARRKQWAPADTQHVIDRLIHYGYLNDHKFAQAWIQSRQLRQNTSLRKLKLELKQKGISDDILQATLATDQYDEAAALRQLIAKKSRLSRYQNDPQKLMQYLARQGFGYDQIKDQLGSYNQD